MITRKLLIIHASRVVRSLLQGHVLAEMDDVTPLEASTGGEAAQMVRKEKVDIILCADILKDCDANELQEKIRFMENGAAIPFIVFTSTSTPEYYSGLNRRGIDHVLISPFSASELRDKIDEVFDPRTLRQQQRFSVPGTKVIIHLDDRRIGADVINLSLNSVFCEFSLPAGHSELLSSIYLSLRFPEAFDDMLISNLYCRLLSIKTVTWLSSDSPDRVRVIWLFKTMSQRNQSILSEILSRVEEQNRRVVTI